MAATGEKTYDWSGADQNPYIHADFNVLNQDAKILNGGLRDTINYGGPTKVVYNGTVNRSGDIVSRVEFNEGGAIWSDPRGPSLTDPATGTGYWFRINGDEGIIFKQASLSDSGSSIVYRVKPITIGAGDIFEIRISPQGLITFKQNNVVLGNVTDTEYLATVAPGGQSEWGSINAGSLASIGMDGVAEDVVTPPSWISNLLPPEGVEGTPYYYDFSSLLEGTPPLLITDMGQPLPNGLAATATTIEGTPTAPGIFTGCVLRVSNGTTGEDSLPFDMSINAAGVLPPAIDNVNIDNTFTSNAAGVITGSGFTAVYNVTLGGWSIPFTVDSDSQISYAAFDVHNTPLSPSDAEVIAVAGPDGTGEVAVEIEPQAGNIYLTALFIDEDPTQIGLLGTASTPAVAGDGYEGPTSMAGSTVVYDPYGPHRDIQPAVPNGTTSVGWHYSEEFREWEQINETTNQTSTPGATLSSPGNVEPVADTAIGVTVTTNVGRGTIYVVATLTSELPNPTPEEIKAGVGESAVSFVVTATGTQEPAYLEGLDPSTRYWYWIVQDTDGLNTFSNVASSTALTTATPVGTPGEAILTNPFTGVSGGTFGSVGVTSSSSLGMLYFVAMLEPEEPSEDDIKFGIGAASHSSAIPKVGVNGPYLLDGLDTTQLYYYWFVQDTNTDESGE